jgi:hypothetical protein
VLTKPIDEPALILAVRGTLGVEEEA